MFDREEKSKNESFINKKKVEGRFADKKQWLEMRGFKKIVHFQLEDTLPEN